MSSNAANLSAGVLQQEARDSMIADFARLLQEVELEADKTRGNMTYHGQSVLIGHLTQNHMERATFLGLSSSPARRTKSVKMGLLRELSADVGRFYEEESDDDLRNIKVRNNGTDTFFKMKGYIRFKKVFDAWCERRSKARSKVAFWFEYERPFGANRHT